MQQKSHVNKKSRETNPALLRTAAMRVINRRAAVKGTLALPCIPSLLDSYMTRLSSLWEALGKPFSQDELSQLRGVVENALNAGYAASPYGHIVIDYQSKPAPEVGISYEIKSIGLTIE